MIQTRHNLPFRKIPFEISSRNDLFSVCFCFLFSIAPHFRTLPLWIVVLALGALIWRCLQALNKVGEVKKWILVPLVLFGGVGVFAEYWTIAGRDAGLALLTVMAAFKFLESRTHRDMLILVFLCYFFIATHFLFSQSILIAMLMLANLVVITATLVTLNRRDNNQVIVDSLLGSSRLVLLSVPLMIVLFVLVPRVPGPLWGLTSEQRGGVTGLSDQMAPGKISNLIRSNEVAFRVSFEGQIPVQNKLYWRGPVMAAFDGYRWSQSDRKPLGQFNLNVFDPPVKYTVTLEPNGEQWLLALDMPTKMVAGSFMTQDFQLIRKEKINDLLRYSMQSRLTYQVGLKQDQDYLELTRAYPANSNPRTIALGQSLAKEFNNPTEIIARVLQMYNQQPFIYTLNPPLLNGDTVDQFLFDSRKGFCEHYAGSFALLMRAAGIPARIVTGYQGGEFNEVGNYLIVRQSDAHAWTEVWLEDRGWVRVDPTAAVSPSRIERGLDHALGDEASNFRFDNRNPLFGQLLFGWDNLQHGWNDWVIDYNTQKQMKFLSNLNLGVDSWADMILAMVLILFLTVASFWLIVWYRERPPRPAEHERQFGRMLQKLARQGVSKATTEDARHFLKRVGPTVAQAEKLNQIIDLYYLIKYSRAGSSAKAQGDLRSLVKHFS